MVKLRKTYQLEPHEVRQFYRLRPLPGVALSFWKNVADARGLDYKSLITDGRSFSGLPKDHGKQWCYPIPLACKRKARYDDAVPVN